MPYQTAARLFSLQRTFLDHHRRVCPLSLPRPFRHRTPFVNEWRYRDTGSIYYFFVKTRLRVLDGFFLNHRKSVSGLCQARWNITCIGRTFIYNFPSHAMSCRLTSTISSLFTLIRYADISLTLSLRQDGYAAVLPTIFSIFFPRRSSSTIRKASWFVIVEANVSKLQMIRARWERLYQKGGG